MTLKHNRLLNNATGFMYTFYTLIFFFFFIFYAFIL